MERHDCALVSGKGFPTKAAGDVLVLMEASDEPLTIFCVHDADGPGTLIYQSLLAGVTKRGGRPVEIVNLGLEPEEALAMGLEPEKVDRSGKKVPVADYVTAKWREWFQTHRIELNEMNTAKFIAWLDRKMAEHGAGKVIPPGPAIVGRLVASVTAAVRDRITQELLKTGGLDRLVAAEMTRLTPTLRATGTRLAADLPSKLAAPRPELWSDLVDQEAAAVAGETGAGSVGPAAG